MALATNLRTADARPSGGRGLSAPVSPSHDSDLAWRLTHAVGEMLALLWGLGALSAVALFVAGIFS
jgi:hypothetical protein